MLVRYGLILILAVALSMVASPAVGSPMVGLLDPHVNWEMGTSASGTCRDRNLSGNPLELTDETGYWALGYTFLISPMWGDSMAPDRPSGIWACGETTTFIQEVGPRCAQSSGFGSGAIELRGHIWATLNGLSWSVSAGGIYTMSGRYERPTETGLVLIMLYTNTVEAVGNCGEYRTFSTGVIVTIPD